MARIRIFIVLALALVAGGTFAFGTYQCISAVPKGGAAHFTPALPAGSFSIAPFGLAMVSVLWAYDGWVNTSSLAEEILAYVRETRAATWPSYLSRTSSASRVACGSPAR